MQGFRVYLSSHDCSLPSSEGKYHAFTMAQSVARSWVKKHKGTAYANVESSEGVITYQWLQGRVTSVFRDAHTGTMIV